MLAPPPLCCKKREREDYAVVVMERPIEPWTRNNIGCRYAAEPRAGRSPRGAKFTRRDSVEMRRERSWVRERSADLNRRWGGKVVVDEEAVNGSGSATAVPVSVSVEAAPVLVRGRGVKKSKKQALGAAQKKAERIEAAREYERLVAGKLRKLGFC